MIGFKQSCPVKLPVELWPIPGRSEKTFVKFQHHPDVIITENDDQKKRDDFKEEIPDPPRFLDQVTERNRENGKIFHIRSLTETASEIPVVPGCKKVADQEEKDQGDPTIWVFLHDHHDHSCNDHDYEGSIKKKSVKG